MFKAGYHPVYGKGSGPGAVTIICEDRCKSVGNLKTKMEDECWRIISIMDRWKTKTDLCCGLATYQRRDPENKGARNHN